MNLNELRDEAYSIANANGWHEEEHSDNHLLMLIITEIAEAVQADRENLHADVEALKKYEGTLDLKENFERQIKNTVEDELSDVVIRCLDLSGLRMIDLDNVKYLVKELGTYNTDESFTEFCFQLSMELGICNLSYLMNNVIADVINYCASHNIDIEFFIQVKMQYNRLRGFKHGGKRY